MRRRTAVLLAALWPAGALAQGAAPAPSCTPRVAATVTLDLVDPEPRILAPLPARQLRAQAGGTSDTAFPHHLGLTVSRVEWRSEVTARARGPADGPVCAVPADVRLRLRHAEHSIRLAREIPPGSCLAEEVLAHERRHAEVNRRTLREAATELRGIARAWAARAEARAPDVGIAATLLQDELAALVDPALERLRAAREAAHAVIDSPAEYRRLSRVCPEDQRRLRAALRA
ncbi:hypothetical protein [Falsiroseomonas oryziterrae]|uniref:hypothetical protein n=1 Tax=Falsiroseomonas oryziterrae TaxID=2911368 RepID=UPI001F23C7E2|nr:hypothetical protein [Roseomonas sp. NPKOSM-4]